MSKDVTREYTVYVASVPVTHVSSTDAYTVGQIGVTIISIESVELATNDRPLKFAQEQNALMVRDHLRSKGLNPTIHVHTTTVEKLN